MKIDGSVVRRLQVQTTAQHQLTIDGRAAIYGTPLYYQTVIANMQPDVSTQCDIANSYVSARWHSSPRGVPTLAAIAMSNLYPSARRSAMQQ